MGHHHLNALARAVRDRLPLVPAPGVSDRSELPMNYPADQPHRPTVIGMAAIVLATAVAWVLLSWVTDSRAPVATIPPVDPLQPAATTTTTIAPTTTVVDLEVAAVVAATPVRGKQIQATPTLPPPLPGIDAARCGRWWPAAVDAGWPVADLPKLDRILWGESRCDPDAHNGRGGDYSFGLLQINVKAGIGTRPFVGPLVDWDWTRLYDPATNLAVGLAMAEHAEASSWANRCRWYPWTTRDRSWCG